MLELPDREVIFAMENSGTYKYLDFQQVEQLEQKHVKAPVKQKYTQRLKNVFNYLLNVGNLIKESKPYTVSVLISSFGIPKTTDLEDIFKEQLAPD